MQMERSWNGLESFEYDVDRTAFLLAKVLQQENPIELDLTEHVSSCNVISLGRCLINEKEKIYKSFAARILDEKKRNTANLILLSQYWMRQFPTDKETLVKFQSVDSKIMHIKINALDKAGKQPINRMYLYLKIILCTFRKAYSIKRLN